MGAWLYLLQVYGFENLLFYGTFIITTVAFWTAALFYLSLDVYRWLPSVTKYKVQPGANDPIDKTKVRRLVARVAFNWFVVNPVFHLLMGPLFSWRLALGPEQDIRLLPTLSRLLAELLACVLVEEVGFYYSHRALHTSALYKHVHKTHHEWTAPVGLAALYSHPLEHAVSNLLPVALGPLVLGSHLVTAWTWYCVALVSTTISHSGYHLPLLPSPEFHDFHHLKFSSCYGVCGLLDYLHGTDAVFRSSKQYHRNIVLVGTEPLTATFPD